MSSYVKGSLIKDEKIIYEGKVSIWSLLPLVIAGLIFLPVFGIGLLLWVVAALRYMSTEMAFTNKRVIAKTGFISRKTVELSISKVESIQVEQGIIGRIFNYGSLVVAGAGNPQAPIPGISEPMDFRRKFLEFSEGNAASQA